MGNSATSFRSYIGRVCCGRDLSGKDNIHVIPNKLTYKRNGTANDQRTVALTLHCNMSIHFRIRINTWIGGQVAILLCYENTMISEHFYILYLRNCTHHFYTSRTETHHILRGRERTNSRPHVSSCYFGLHIKSWNKMSPAVHIPFAWNRTKFIKRLGMPMKIHLPSV
jgi:hypothetical protein